MAFSHLTSHQRFWQRLEFGIIGLGVGMAVLLAILSVNSGLLVPYRAEVGGSSSSSSVSSSQTSSSVSSGTSTSAAGTTSSVSYEEWRYQEYLRLKAEYEAKGETIPESLIPEAWEIPEAYANELAASSVAGGTQNPSRAMGCFREDNSWSTDGKNCAADQGKIFEQLSGLNSLQRTEYEDSIPMNLLMLIDTSVPPPQPKTPAEEEAVLALMRSTYIDDGEGGERQAASNKLREALVEAEERLKTLQKAGVGTTAAGMVQSTLAWITDMKKTTALNLLSLAEIHAAASELNERLADLQEDVFAGLPSAAPAKEIHRRIDLLMQMMDIDVPRALSAKGLSLPPDAGILILELRSDILAMQASDCWNSSTVCPEAPGVLAQMNILMESIDDVTTGHDAVRYTLSRRFTELQSQR